MNPDARVHPGGKDHLCAHPEYPFGPMSVYPVDYACRACWVGAFAAYKTRGDFLRPTRDRVTSEDAEEYVSSLLARRAADHGMEHLFPLSE